MFIIKNMRKIMKINQELIDEFLIESNSLIKNNERPLKIKTRLILTNIELLELAKTLLEEKMEKIK